MTIIAGFPGNGFVVLGADSDESGGLAKASVRKIAVIDKGECKCLIGGAGHGDFIDLAVQQINAELHPPFSVIAVNELIEDIVTNIYSERIDSYPVHEQDDLRFELLCGVWVKDDPIAPQLIRVSRALHLVRTAPETIGVGSYLARYLIATLTTLDNNTMITAAFRLAVYLIAQVKKHAKDCGGQTQVLGITKDGRVMKLKEATIAQHENTASIVMERAMPFLLYTTDPYWISRDKINEAVDFAAQKIKEELADALPQLPAPPAQPTQGELMVPPATSTPSSPLVETEQQPVRRDRSVTMRERRSLPPSRG
jgi:hypothetical protein